MNFGYYDVLMENFTLKPLILAMSEVDAMHIAEVKYGMLALDAAPSCDDNVYSK